MTVVRGLRGHRGIVGESGGGLWRGHHHGARPSGLPLPLPRWASPGGPPPQGGRPPKGGVGGGPRAPRRWWRGAPGVGGAPQATKVLWSVHKVLFDDLCGPCVGYARPSAASQARLWQWKAFEEWLARARGRGSSERPRRWVRGRSISEGDALDGSLSRAWPWTDADGSASRGSPGPSTYPRGQEP